MLKKRILAKGYPLNDPSYPVAHMIASKEELHKFGKTGYEKLNTISHQHKNELLGTHDIHGHIIISKIVPPSLRAEVRFHERKETELMKRMKRK